MGAAIKELTVEGFKSIRKLDQFELRKLNVLIGANGAGKSNFIEFLRLIHAIAKGDWPIHVAKEGGGDGLFFGGPKMTPVIRVRLRVDTRSYGYTLEPAADGRIVMTRLSGDELKDSDFVEAWAIYHFHDTSSLSPMRRDQSIEDTAYLRPDASNIAAFLRLMREQNPPDYNLIRDTIRLVAPFFDDFLLKQRKNGNETKVALDWHQKGSDFPFQAWHLSDGTLRFICLATALLQPDPPPTIVIDEPELGLHPHALEVLAGLLQKASQRTQVIVSTQSAPLLSQFEPEDVITVCRKDGASVFGRLDRKDLADWMKDYTLGELWQKNVVEARASDD
jgi:predicted ATPase